MKPNSHPTQYERIKLENMTIKEKKNRVNQVNLPNPRPR